ncbi:hypothetical protein BFN67_22915 [Pseudaminobacter manganicus]|uniref:Sugar ABC transporter substrate-binding protein n=1 Tax=Manganibacter manganicus TaxID=1873176 RepID=A0A1V8RLI9_9HYPH|nr:hypothetical protein BFN67_22915 [Pseudaminobacter manganicus]
MMLGLGGAVLFGLATLGSSAQTQELQVWKYGSPKAERDYFTKINEGFPGGKVTWESQDWETRAQGISTATIAGNLPDVLAADNTVLGKIAEAGAVLPLDEIAADKVVGWAANYPKELWELGKYGGKSYGMSTFVDLSPVIIYNAAMLEAAGVQPPRTWSQLRAAAKALNKDGVAGIVFAASTTTLDTDIIQSIIPVNGGRWLDHDGKPAMGGQALVDTFQLVKDLTQYAPQGIVDANFRDALQLFYQGRAAMVITKSFAPIIQTDYEVPADFPAVMISFPKPDKVTGSFPPASFEAHAPFLFLVTSQTDDKELAVEYLDYWFDPKQHYGWDGSEVKGRVPTAHAMLRSEGFKQQYPALAAAYEEGTLFDNVVSIPFFPEYPDLRRSFSEALQGVVLGVVTPEQAAADVENATKAAIAK